MTKTLKIIVGLLLGIFLTISVKTAVALERVPLEDGIDEVIPTQTPTPTQTETPPACNQETFEVDADEDNDTFFDFTETGGKVQITFNDLDGTPPSEDDRDQVIVTTGTGYEIVNVQYELEHYSGIGWITVPGNNPTTTITLAGTDDDSRIDEVEVKLKTICATPTPTVTPTNAPSNSVGPGDGLSDHRSDGRSSCPECTQAPQGQVLGASTMAGTGTFEQNLMNSFAIFGMLLLTAGYKSFRKETSKILR